MLPIEYAFWGIIMHLLADWPLQNAWMSKYKINLNHPAAWVHGFFHFICTITVFPFWPTVAIVGLHILIDTRKPLTLWKRIWGQTTEGEMGVHVGIWLDQVVHILVIAAIAWLA